ncbi:MAG TPA: ribonuclease D [Candidatus Hydrogenedens sp.]|nr:ribonuclease D [Candidatus Hydrogenedens sp.]HOK09903.1 ribonuclease D [Candidatus Hydrogenedens sp.]HOL19782.1 ribonuclease D [Candidatus Hydrogenedens sp.]HPP59521.1 ribonuclease D [Candidatus Hydrogenedens sp.]
MPHKNIDFVINNYNLIQTRKDWEKVLKILSNEPKIALDLEANSIYEYPGEICLIQISVRGYDFLLDPLANFDFSELGTLLANPNIEKIFHACEYDLRLLWTQYRWEVKNLFDTMWAGKLLGYKHLGLVFLLHSILNINHDKKYQKSDWKKRPLSEQQLSYAYRDSHYLIPLEEIMKEKLIEKGLWEEAKEIFEELPHEFSKDEDASQFLNLLGNRNLPEKNIKALKALYYYRKTLAEKIHIQPNKLISNRCLINISRSLPTSLEKLEKIQGAQSISKHINKQELIKIIGEALINKEPINISHRKNNDPRVKNRVSLLMKWRRNLATSRNLDSDVVLTKNKISILAHAGPKTHSDLIKLKILGPVRLKMYGEQILNILKISDDFFDKKNT